MRPTPGGTVIGGEEMSPQEKSFCPEIGESALHQVCRTSAFLAVLSQDTSLACFSRC
jgi:hypothetical protein